MVSILLSPSHAEREKKVANIHTHSFLQSRYALDFGYHVNKKEPSSSFSNKNKIINPATERVFAPWVFFVKSWEGGVGGRGCEKKEKLTERNPSKIPYLLYYDVGISCSEKQLPDMDQSIRYISYFSRRKRKEEGEKKLLALFYCIHIVRYVEIKNSTAGRGWGGGEEGIKGVLR